MSGEGQAKIPAVRLDGCQVGDIGRVIGESADKARVVDAGGKGFEGWVGRPAVIEPGGVAGEGKTENGEEG